MSTALLQEPELEPTECEAGVFRTEICSRWNKGYCGYGSKCQFAHGAHELKPRVRPRGYKTELCQKFVATGGHCPYGKRCLFIHALPTLEGGPPPFMSQPPFSAQPHPPLPGMMLGMLPGMMPPGMVPPGGMRVPIMQNCAMPRPPVMTQPAAPTPPCSPCGVSDQQAASPKPPGLEPLARRASVEASPKPPDLEVPASPRRPSAEADSPEVPTRRAPSTEVAPRRPPGLELRARRSSSESPPGLAPGEHAADERPEMRATNKPDTMSIGALRLGPWSQGGTARLESTGTTTFFLCNRLVAVGARSPFGLPTHACSDVTRPPLPAQMVRSRRARLRRRGRRRRRRPRSTCSLEMWLLLAGSDDAGSAALRWFTTLHRSTV